MSSSDELNSPTPEMSSESIATESVATESVATESVATATEAATTPELTEVDPTPSDESITMKVSETESEEQMEEKKVDPHVALMQMPIIDQNSALNCLIGFIGIAQRRGVFALDEAAKAFECIKQFHNAN